MSITPQTPRTPASTGHDLAVSDVRASQDGAASSQPQIAVGRGRHIARLIGRRIKYIARFVLWTLRHRSTEHVRWVLAFEGTSWN